MRLELENNLSVLYLDGKISNINAVEVEKNINDALKNLAEKKISCWICTTLNTFQARVCELF